MKKIIIGILVLIILIAGFSIFNNKEEIKTFTDKPKDIVVKEDNVAFDNWLIFSNSKLNIEFSYPSNFTSIDENDLERSSYPKTIEFESAQDGLDGDLELKIYPNQANQTKDLNGVPKLTNETNSDEELQIKNITSTNSVPVQIVRGTQYVTEAGKLDKSKPSIMASIAFMDTENSYSINWICWSNRACFNDKSLETIANSIKVK